VLGTTNYMAPEQAEGAAHVDQRADLFAAGVVAFQTITGLLPFSGGSAMEVLRVRLREEARSLTEATGLSWRKRLEGFFRQALARAPSARFPSAGAMLDAWRAATSAGTWPSVDRLREHAAELAETTREETLDALSSADGAVRAVNGGR
jgi:serine/threonine protein kinase